MPSWRSLREEKNITGSSYLVGSIDGKVEKVEIAILSGNKEQKCDS